MHISGSCFTLSQRNVAPSIEECCIEACHNFLKKCHILSNFQRWLMRSMLWPLESELMLYQGLITHFFSKEQYAYPCKTFHISLCRELCQEDAVLLGGQNEIFCQSKVLVPLVHACYKNLHLSMAQQGKIEFSLWYSLAKWHRTVDTII